MKSIHIQLEFLKFWNILSELEQLQQHNTIKNYCILYYFQNLNNLHPWPHKENFSWSFLFLNR